MISDEQRLLDALVAAFRIRWPEVELLGVWDATAAVQLAVERNPELVVLDADLSRHTGLDVLADIRHVSNAAIVLLTSGRLSDESRGLAGDADLRLAKPFSTRALIGFARHVLDGRDQISRRRRRSAIEDGADQQSDVTVRALKRPASSCGHAQPR